jgi:hypothetical protein
VLCEQYKCYIAAKGRGKYAEQDFQPHDLAILPHYVIVKFWAATPPTRPDGKRNIIPCTR